MVLVHHQLPHEQPPGRRHKLSEHCFLNYHNPREKSLVSTLGGSEKSTVPTETEGATRRCTSRVPGRESWTDRLLPFQSFRAEICLSLSISPLAPPLQCQPSLSGSYLAWKALPAKCLQLKPPAALSFREFKSSSLWNKTSIPWPGSQDLPIIQAELNLIPVLSIPIITQNYLSANIYSGLIKCMTYKFIYILFLVLKHRQERKIFGSYLQGPHNLVGDIKAYSQR